MVDVSSEDFASLVGTIYDAAFDVKKWQDFVQQLSRAVGGTQIVMHGHDYVTKQSLGAVQCGMDPQFLDNYQAHFDATNVWVPGIAKMKIGRVGAPEDFFPRDDLFRTEYYND